MGGTSSAPTRIALREIDVFTGARARANTTQQAVPPTDPLVRRPLRGIQLKKDTFASIVVLLPDGRTIDLVNSSASPEAGQTIGHANHTANFLLTGVQQEKSEKFQPLLTFGPTWGFFFGEHPHMYSFSALLLNTQDFSWELEWWENYDTYFRGTALTENRARVFLSFDDYVIEGYLVNARTGRAADDPHIVQLSFSMWVTASETLRVAGDTTARTFDTGGAADVPSTFDITSNSLELLRQNILMVQAGKADAGLGLFGKLRQTLQKLEDKLEAASDAVRSFLVQENLVVPGRAEDIMGPTGPQFSWKVPAPYQRPSTVYFDNKDEYLSGTSWEGTSVAQQESMAFPWGYQSPTKTVAYYSKLVVAIPPALQKSYKSSSSTALTRFLGKVAFAALAIGPALVNETLDKKANEEKQKAQRAREDVLLGNLSDREAARRLTEQQEAEERARDYAAASNTTKTLQGLAEELL